MVIVEVAMGKTNAPLMPIVPSTLLSEMSFFTQDCSKKTKTINA
jgi:hypothetical protein